MTTARHGAQRPGAAGRGAWTGALLALTLHGVQPALAAPPRTTPPPPSRPLPERPADAPLPPAQGAAPDRPAAAEAPPAEAPLPEVPPRVSALPASLILPPLRPLDRPAPPAPGDDVEACRARLRGLGVRFDVLPPIQEGACGAPAPVRVQGLAGNLDLVPASVVTCPVAEALARWAGESVVPEAVRLLGRAPRRLRIGGAYECRGRNRVAGAKLSEHGFANALDLMGVEFVTGAAYTVAAQKAGSPEERFQAAIRAGACARFSTVLGPGSDASHHDHIHVDLRARRGGAMCQ